MCECERWSENIIVGYMNTRKIGSCSSILISKACFSFNEIFKYRKCGGRKGARDTPVVSESVRLIGILLIIVAQVKRICEHRIGNVLKYSLNACFYCEA